jgi:hypothetical protein
MLSHLMSIAAALSGYPELPASEAPLLRVMAPQALIAEACPDQPAQCERLVAFYDRDRQQILIRDDLDLDDATDNSFLVHEFVHVLEARQKGAAYQTDCETTLQSEREAYRVQNRYLQQEGRSERFGSMLATMACARDQSAAGKGGMQLEIAPGAAAEYRVLDDFMQQLREGAAAAQRR